MGLIEEIRAKISRGEFEYSQHAVDQTILRRISVQELRDAIAAGEVILDRVLHARVQGEYAVRYAQGANLIPLDSPKPQQPPHALPHRRHLHRQPRPPHRR